MSHTLGLAARLVEGGAPHAVGAPGLTRAVSDTIGQLRVTGPDSARFESDDVTQAVQIPRNTRIFCERNPEAIWVADLSASEERGVLVPFAPPRRVRLTEEIPIQVHESLIERLADARLRIGDDLGRVGLALRRPRIAVVGQRAIAALDEDDGRTVTWWLPGGGALELRVAANEEGGTLHLLDLVAPKDARMANCGPSALVMLAPNVRLVLTHEGSAKPVSRAAIAPFEPARSPLFDAWARYTALARIELETRERARGVHPIAYEGARQRERRWIADARLAEDAMSAWLGAEAVEGRVVPVRQPVARVEGEREEGPYTVESARLRGPGLVELELSSGRGAAPLPESGTLEARADKGERKRREREREAVDRLASGRASCPTLVEILGRPAGASSPTPRALPMAPAEHLDEDQLRAVQLIVGCVDMVAIQGPPGTGKTRVIVEAIRQIEAAARKKGERVRVLISSVQNEAVANVVERLATSGNMVVRLVRREARDEDEAFDFANWSRKQGDEVVGQLEARLTGDPTADTLARVREAEAEIDELAGWLALGPAAYDVVAARLRTLAAQEKGLIGGLLLGEATKLADALQAPESANVPGSLPPLPEGPEAVASWWAVARDRCAAEQRAEVGMAVQALTEALTIPNAVKRGLLLSARWKTFEKLARELRPAAQEKTTSRFEDPVGALDAWVAQARANLTALRSGIEARPGAVALRFLQALREDPRAWASIVERHGNAVASTCSMSATAARDPGEAYDWVIIDEAGRASPFELLVPMVQGQRIVLIGDHRQLPPTVDEALVRKANEVSAAPADIRYETLFGALFTLLPPGCRARLSVQYRMHAAIGALVDRLFYRPHGEPLASGFTGPREDERRVPWDMFGRRPLSWVEVAPRGEYSEENPEEANAVVDLLRRYEAGGAEAGSVAVICPYARQRALLKKKLAGEPTLQRISQLKTIDAVQGREYPVVILCLVRTDRRPGFLASPNRLNVAISRAQHQLVVVGASRRFLDGEAVRTRAPALRALVEALLASAPQARGVGAEGGAQ